MASERGPPAQEFPDDRKIHEQGENVTEMTPKARRLFDARADMEAWELAHSILEPWVESTRRIGSDELTQVMEGALEEVNDQIRRHYNELERIILDEA
jgi:hypothetical protein